MLKFYLVKESGEHRKNLKPLKGQHNPATCLYSDVNLGHCLDKSCLDTNRPSHFPASHLLYVTFSEIFGLVEA